MHYYTKVSLQRYYILADRASLWGACCVWLEFRWTWRACTQDALNAARNYNSGRGSATRIKIMLTPIQCIRYYCASALIYYVV